MRITVLGTGYVGLTQGACMAEIGHDVMCVDIDAEKIKKLKRGHIPFYEPGLESMVGRNVSSKRLCFSTDVKKGVHHGEVIFSAVGTPPDADHRADLTAVRAVARDVGNFINEYKVFVNKSTVPVGTAQECRKLIIQSLEKRKKAYEFDVVSNPEFLREGVAVQDALKPDRIVVGTDSKKAEDIMRKLNTPIIEKGSAFYVTSIESAEVIKYASNALLATKISFMNEVAHLCERVGADITEVEHGVGLDSRIGRRFLHAGIGFGGSCFPKDIQALIETGKDHGYKFRIISEVQNINQEQKELLVKKLSSYIHDLNKKTVALWGLAFKQKTDDMRQAPSLTIIDQLKALGAHIRAYDPEAMPRSKKIISDIQYAKTAFDAARGADALLIITDWDEFRGVDFTELKKVMRGTYIGDGRNIWNPVAVRAAGFTYFSIGRK